MEGHDSSEDRERVIPMTPYDCEFLKQIENDITALFNDEYPELSQECHSFIYNILRQIIERQTVNL